MNNTGHEAIIGSFRDPCGDVFCRDGAIYRRVNVAYKDDYDFLINSGLYKKLAGAGLLVSHEEVSGRDENKDPVYKIIRPEKIPCISYPYEWCFGQLKAAAGAILKIQKIALDYEMSLKDASAYNMQFIGTRPVLIDTLSFEKYREGLPWGAYRQFCQHFLAPLAVMSSKDVRLGQLSRIYIDGIGLDLASKLLPAKTWLSPPLLAHIHVHAGFQSHFSGKAIDRIRGRMNKTALSALIDSLVSGVEKISLRSGPAPWADYYKTTGYADRAFEDKKRIVSKFLDETASGMVWDCGANTGLFSRIAADKGRRVISFDSDFFCVEENYRRCLKEGGKNILPLLADFTNPAPGTGWINKERLSLLERGPAQTALALALIHHLAISNNLPLKYIAGFFKEICEYLIIEFIPKDDPQARRLLASRHDVFPDYTRQHFEDEFAAHFEIKAREKITDSERSVYLMKRR